MALAIVGMNGNDAGMVSAAYLSMKVITWYVIIPLSLAGPISGVVLSLTTRWGLFRHYWIVLKFVIATLATLFLLVHIQPISLAAQTPAQTLSVYSDFRMVQIQLLVAPALATIVLIVAVALAVYMPKGLTRYGWRKLRKSRV